MARLLRSRVESAIGDKGLRPRHVIALLVLRGHGGQSTQQALATSLRIDRTNLVGLLDELEDQRLVARTRNRTDRRRHIVELTAKGEHELAEAERRSTTTEDDLLSATERDTLRYLLLTATARYTIDCGEDDPHPTTHGRVE